MYGPDGTFTPAAPMAQARTGAACVAVEDGRVLVTGGTDGASALASAEIYDPALNTWESAGAMAVARAGHTAALMPWGSVLIVGGDSNGTPIGFVEQYDVSNGKFLTAGALSSPRKDSAIAVLPNHQAIIAGGSDGSSALATVDLYDPNRGAVVPAGTLLKARTNFAAASLLDGTVLVTGGFDAAGNVLSSAEIFDPVQGVSAVAPDMSEARANHRAYTLPNNGRVLLVGGANGAGTLASTDSYAPQTGKFAETAPMNVARSGGATSPLGRGALIVAGGQSAYGYLASSEVYSFATIETDKSDYPPETLVTMTGSGWKPGETVLVQVTAFPLDQHRIEFTGAALADGTGQIRLTGFQVDQSHLGMRFLLTATGSESQAETLFSDGLATTTTVSASAAEQTFGTPVTFTATVTNTGSGATPTGTVTFSDTFKDPDGNTVAATLGGGPIGFSSSSGNTAQAQVTVSDLYAYYGTNTHTIHAIYTPSDSTFNASATCSPVGPGCPVATDATYKVDQCVPQILVTAAHVPPNSGYPIAVGEGIRITATVSTVAGVTPTGYFNFYINGTRVDTGLTGYIGVALVNGSAYFDYLGVLLAQPSVSIGVNYLDGYDPNYKRQLFSVNQITQPVAGALTTTTVSSTVVSPVTYGTSVTYTATITSSVSGTIGGTATFQDNGVAIHCVSEVSLGTVNVSSGAAQCVPSSLPAAGTLPHPITAVYNGDSNFSGSTSAAYNLQVNAEPTTTTLAQPADSTLNGTISYVATVTGSPVTPTGTVDFKDVTVPGSPIGLCSGVSVVGGTYTCSVTYSGGDVAHQPGTHKVQAFFNSNDSTNIANSTSSAPGVTVNVSQGAAPLVNLASSQGNSYYPYGTATNLTVALTPGNPTPAYSGTVQFVDGSTVPPTALGTVTLTFSGGTTTAALNSVVLSLGSHSITAQFGSDPNYSASSSSLTITVNTGPTSTVTLGTIGSSQGASYTYGTATNLTVALTPGNPTPAYTGTVQFVDGSTPIGTVTLTSGGTTTTAALNGVVLGGGTHNITAQFLGDTNYGTSAMSATLSIVVSKATPALTNGGAGTFPGMTYGGQIPSVGAITVPRPSGASASAAYPTGTVTLTAGPGLVQVGSPGTLSGTGTVTFTNAQLPATLAPGVGLNLVVTYNGDNNYNSAPLIPNLSLTVTQAAPTGTLITSGTPSDYNSSVTFTLTLGPPSGNVGMPTGPVNFYADYNYVTPLNPAPVTVNSLGVASFGYSGLAPGVHPITATYIGDTNFTAVTSGSPFTLVGTNQTVRAVNTRTTVNPSATNPSFNSTVTYTVTVQGGPAATPPQGSVEVDDGGPGNAVCSITLVGGEGSCAVTYNGTSTPLAVHSGGTHSITASYTSTDHNKWLDSTSTPIIVTVAKINVTLGTVGSSQGASYTYGTATNLTVTLTPGNPTPAYTGTVQFLDGSTPLSGTVTLTSGGGTTTATLYGAVLGGGSRSITAQFGADLNYSASSPSPPLAITVNKASSSPATGTTSYTATYGGTLTTSAISVPATGSGAAPTGTLTLAVGSSQIGNPGTLSSGSFTFTNAQLPVSLNAAAGAQALLVTYSGDNNYSSTTLSLSLTVSKAFPSGTLATSGTPSAFNTTVTFTLTLGPPAGSAGIPAGTVNFYADGALLNTTPVTVTSGVASFGYSGLAPGAHTITATYSGDTDFYAVVPASPFILGGGQTVTEPAIITASTWTMLTASSYTLALGGTVTYAVTVTGGTPAPMGTVQIADNGYVICVPPSIDVPGGSQTCTVTYDGSPYHGAGVHSISAVFTSADGTKWSGSVAVSLIITVSKATPTIAAPGFPTAANFGGSLNSGQITVSPPLGTNAVNPTGTVSLSSGATSIGGAGRLDGNGHVTINAVLPTALTIGNQNLTIAYGGDSNYNPATLAVTLNVTKAVVNVAVSSPTIAALAGANPVYGQPVVLTATFTGVTGIPVSGTVSFVDGATTICAAVAITNGVATCTVPAFEVGSHTISVASLSDPIYTLTGGAISQLGFNVVKANTTTVVSASPNPSALGQSVTFTATVSVVAPGAASVNGNTVAFSSGPSTLGTCGAQLVAGGQATCTATFTTAGLNAITATYGGDSHTNSSSGAFVQNVIAPTVTTLGIIPVLSASNQQVTLTAVVSAPPGAGNPTGTVQFVNTTSHTTLGTAPLTVIGGVATASITISQSNQSSPPQLFTATYSGATSFTASTSAPQGLSLGARVGVTNAASYATLNFAPDELASLFGTNLANTTLPASATPLPTSLGGTTVQVTDSAGVQRLAQLIYVSPLQVNFLVPTNTALGLATVTVTGPDGATASAIVLVTRTAPGLFSQNTSGQGVAAAQIIRVGSSGVPVVESVAVYDPTQQQWVARPIDIGDATETLFLVLYGTGIRHNPGSQSVTATINGQSVLVAYAGPQPQFAGEDQVNLGPLPSSLQGAGTVNVQITVDGQPSNTVTVTFQ
jgi:hypothetical protein